MVGVLRGEGYRFVDADEFLASPHGRCAYLTFDDNYRSWHRALALLDELEVRATFYVNTRYFRDWASPSEIEDFYDRLEYDGERVPLTTSELLDLDEAGHTIGAHTHSHRALASLPPEEAKREVRRSKEVLEALLGKRIRHFSYPYGMRRHFTEGLRDYCLQIGFDTVANAIPGLQHAPQTPDRIHRVAWHFRKPPSYNLDSIRIDGRYFERLTGRSATG